MSLELRNEKINDIKSLENLSYDDLLVKKASRAIGLIKDARNKAKNTPAYDELHKLHNSIKDTIDNINDVNLENKKDTNIEKLESLISSEKVNDLFNKERKDREETLNVIFNRIEKNIEKLSQLDENHPEIENLIDIQDTLTRSTKGDTIDTVFTSDLNNIKAHLKAQRKAVDLKIKGFNKLEEKAPIKKEYSTPEVKSSSLDEQLAIFQGINTNDNNELVLVQAQMAVEALDMATNKLEEQGKAVPHELISSVKNVILQQINIINTEKDPKKIAEAQKALQETLDENYLTKSSNELQLKKTSTDISPALGIMLKESGVNISETPTHKRIEEKFNEFEEIVSLLIERSDAFALENEKDERIFKLQDIRLVIENMFNKGMLYSIEKIDTKSLKNILKNLSIASPEIVAEGDINIIGNGNGKISDQFDAEDVPFEEIIEDNGNKPLPISGRKDGELSPTPSENPEDEQDGPLAGPAIPLPEGKKISPEEIEDPEKLGPALDEEFAPKSSTETKDEEELSTEEMLKRIFANRDEILGYLNHYEQRINSEKVFGKIIEIMRAKTETISELENNDYENTEEFKTSIKELLEKTSEAFDLIDEYKKGNVKEADEFNHFKDISRVINQIPALIEKLREFMTEKEIEDLKYQLGEIITDKELNKNLMFRILTADPYAADKFKNGALKITDKKGEVEDSYNEFEGNKISDLSVLEEKDGNIIERIEKDNSVSHPKIVASTNSSKGTKKETTIKAVTELLNHLYENDPETPIKLLVNSKFKESQEAAIEAIDQWVADHENEGIDHSHILNYADLVAAVEGKPSKEGKKVEEKQEEKTVEKTPEVSPTPSNKEEPKVETPKENFTATELRDFARNLEDSDENLNKSRIREIKLIAEKQVRFEKGETIRKKGISQEEINSLYKELLGLSNPVENTEEGKGTEPTISTPNEEENNSVSLEELQSLITDISTDKELNKKVKSELKKINRKIKKLRRNKDVSQEDIDNIFNNLKAIEKAIELMDDNEKEDRSKFLDALNIIFQKQPKYYETYNIEHNGEGNVVTKSTYNEEGAINIQSSDAEEGKEKLEGKLSEITKVQEEENKKAKEAQLINRQYNIRA
ncbi:MAG: hypothetical protein N4A44_04090 [Alphaproteobacteria bacterium]|jgi:hypothetical protein|nr:hypothetical protein [Alphaproteobacteria bacterium]